jgi:hypothetical protein
VLAIVQIGDSVFGLGYCRRPIMGSRGDGDQMLAQGAEFSLR